MRQSGVRKAVVGDHSSGGGGQICPILVNYSYKISLLNPLLVAKWLLFSFDNFLLHNRPTKVSSLGLEGAYLGAFQSRCSRPRLQGLL